MSDIDRPQTAAAAATHRPAAPATAASAAAAAAATATATAKTATAQQTSEPAPAAAPIRVLVADDHPIVRGGIVGLLSRADDIDVIAEASDGADAVRLATELRPDLVLMDLRMPMLSGVEATARIIESLPEVRVLILTTYETDDDILGAIEAGASGYLLKAAPQDEILAGIRSVVGGRTVLAPEIAAKLVDRMRAGAAGASGAAAAAPERPLLSAREVEVLRLVAAGTSNPKIARALFISEATVKTHLLHVFEKLGVNDRTRAVTLALERGIL